MLHVCLFGWEYDLWSYVASLHLAGSGIFFAVLCVLLLMMPYFGVSQTDNFEVFLKPFSLVCYMMGTCNSKCEPWALIK